MKHMILLALTYSEIDLFIVLWTGTYIDLCILVTIRIWNSPTVPESPTAPHLLPHHPLANPSFSKICVAGVIQHCIFYGGFLSSCLLFCGLIYSISSWLHLMLGCKYAAVYPCSPWRTLAVSSVGLLQTDTLTMRGEGSAWTQASVSPSPCL